MSQIEKLVQKFLEKPKSIKYRELVLLLKYFGFEQIPAKGSHVKFSHDKLQYDLVIPVHKNECKDFYKEQAKKYIQKISQNKQQT